MEAYLSILQDGVAAVGTWFVVPFLLLENIPIIGLVAPGLTVLVLSGFFHTSLVAHPLTLYLVAWITIVIADNIWYWLGYLAGRRSVWLQKLAKQSPNVEEILTKQPLWALVTYQFIAYFRMFLPFLLGLYKLAPRKWLLINVIGSFLYVTVFLSIGVVGTALLGSIAGVEQITSQLNYVLGVFAAMYGLSLYYKYRKLQRKGQFDKEEGV